MNWLGDLPKDAKARLAEVMAEVVSSPTRNPGSIGVHPVRHPKVAHGTRSGYERHRQNHERTCDACRAAERDYRRRHRA